MLPFCAAACFACSGCCKEARTGPMRIMAAYLGQLLGRKPWFAQLPQEQSWLHSSQHLLCCFTCLSPLLDALLYHACLQCGRCCWLLPCDCCRPFITRPGYRTWSLLLLLGCLNQYDLLGALALVRGQPLSRALPLKARRALCNRCSIQLLCDAGSSRGHLPTGISLLEGNEEWAPGALQLGSRPGQRGCAHEVRHLAHVGALCERGRQRVRRALPAAELVVVRSFPRRQRTPCRPYQCFWSATCMPSETAVMNSVLAPGLCIALQAALPSR